MSAGAGSAFHRSRMDMASHPCGLAHGHGDERPTKKTKQNKKTVINTRPCSAESKFRLVQTLTCTNRAPHVSHLYGFSPEWMRV